MKIIKVTQTCTACPSQWDAVTDDNRIVYIRYRWGHLTISVGEPNDTDEWAGVNGRVIFAESIGDSFDGFMTYTQLTEYTRKLIDWPEHETE